jgi:hypothetical protein
MIAAIVPSPQCPRGLHQPLVNLHLPHVNRFVCCCLSINIIRLPVHAEQRQRLSHLQSLHPQPPPQYPPPRCTCNRIASTSPSSAKCSGDPPPAGILRPLVCTQLHHHPDRTLSNTAGFEEDLCRRCKRKALKETAMAPPRQSIGEE